MDERFQGLGFYPADILLPRDCDLTKWAVVACDQYTSQPEYWQRVEFFVGNSPSALHLILPESSLEGPSVETDILDINNTMSRYLREGRFRTLEHAMIYVERTLESGRVRRGVVGMVDLEQYDYEPGADTLIRATEGTVLSRIPPRVAVRKNAPIELPHAMVLADDPAIWWRASGALDCPASSPRALSMCSRISGAPDCPQRTSVSGSSWRRRWP